LSAIFILIGASLSIATGFLIAFIWSVKTGQYDDDHTPSIRMLLDDVNTTDDNILQKKKSEHKKKITTAKE
jgi:cbb3-type cytochrome oxidase maturation protein